MFNLSHFLIHTEALYGNMAICDDDLVHVRSKYISTVRLLLAAVCVRQYACQTHQAECSLKNMFGWFRSF